MAEGVLDPFPTELSSAARRFLQKRQKWICWNGSKWDLSTRMGGDERARYLAEALKLNSSVTELRIRKNFLGEKGAFYLSEALKINSSVSRIDLGGNYFGHQGARHIATSLEINSAVTEIK
eukprot:m.254825 g.254825  ORF g.254825 m.254825 type:complete len:121 (-) comp15494_c4_seq1:249-611(-)